VIDSREQESAVEQEAFIAEPGTAPQRSDEVFKLSREVVNYVLVGLVFLVAGALLGVTLGGSGVDERALRGIVQDVVSNEIARLEIAAPIVMQSNGGMDQAAIDAQVQQALDDALRRQRYLEGNDPYMGPTDAPVVMVEFSDFFCSFCGRHYRETLQPLLENYEGVIRYVYRDFPSVGGQNAVQAAQAAHCADDQGRFWDYHAILFDNQMAPGREVGAMNNILIGYADELGLDVETFTTCLESEKYLNDVIQDASEGQANGVRGTPSFFINGTFVSGAQPYEVFANIIDAELARQGIEREG
jgi:protein-disulfide isomerase